MLCASLIVGFCSVSSWAQPEAAAPATGIVLDNGLVISPSVALSQGYDDNVYATASDTVSDFFTTISPSLRFEWSTSELYLSLTAAANLTRYWSETSENADDYQVGLSGTHTLSPTQTLRADARFQRAAISRSDPDTVQGDERAERETIALGLSFTQQFVRLGVQVGGTASFIDASPSSEDDQDRSEYGADLRIFYEMSPALSLFVQPQLRVVRYDETDPVDRDFRTWALLGGASFDFNQILTGQLAAGFAYQDYASGEFEDDMDLTIQGTLGWRPTDLTTVTAGISRTFDPTTVADAGGRVSTRLTLALNHELYRDILVDLDIGAALDEYGSVDRTDLTLTFGAGVNFLINRNLAAFAQYSLAYRTSDDPDQEYSRNNILLGLRAQF